MTYYATSTNSVTAATDIIAAIEAGLSANTNWSFIEQTAFTQAGQPKIARVWKCSSAGNSGAQDFYVQLVRFATDSLAEPFSIRLSEGYDLTTHSVIRPAPSPAASVAVSATDYSIGNGTLYSLTLTSGVGTQLDAALTMPGSASPMDHFLVVGNSFFAYGINQSGAALAGYYVGNFNPAYSSTYNPVVLACAYLGAQTQFQATRFPNCTVTNTATNGDAFLAAAAQPNGYLTATAAVPEKYSAKMEAASAVVWGLEIVSAGAVAQGGIRGSLPSSLMLIPHESAAPRNGDFFVVSGVNYFRCGAGVPISSPAAGYQGWYVSQSASY